MSKLRENSEKNKIRHFTSAPKLVLVEPGLVFEVFSFDSYSPGLNHWYV